MEWRDNHPDAAGAGGAASAETSPLPLLRSMTAPKTPEMSPLLPPSGDGDHVMREDPSPWMPVVAPTDNSILDVLSGAAEAFTKTRGKNGNSSSSSSSISSAPSTGSTPTQHSLSDSVFCVEETPPRKPEVIFFNYIFKMLHV